MALLLGLVPWWARLVAVLAVAATLFGYGYVKGLKSGEERLADYEAKSAQLAAQQQVATAKTVAAQKEVTNNVSQDYAARLAALRAGFIGLRNAGAASSAVPAVPATASRVDGNAADGVSLERFEQLEADAAETTLELVELQAWVQRQQVLFNKE
jgi:hypothetical protein